MSEHTNEPWIVTGGERVKYVEARVGGGIIQEIASCMQVAHGNHEANARRIVACVNACMGIRTENLEDNRPIVEGLKLLNRQRDELLAALEPLSQWGEVIAALPSFSAKGAMLEDFDDARAAIARAVGPAFPAPARFNAELGHWDADSHFVGLSLRDYFAAKALPALIDLCLHDDHEGKTYAEHCANNAYEMADAMISASEVPK